MDEDEIKNSSDKMKEMFDSNDEESIQQHLHDRFKEMDLDAPVVDNITSVKKQDYGDCVSANADAFLNYLALGKYPSQAKILPNIEGQIHGAKWHQLIEFQKLIKGATDWRLVQGTIINQEDLHPMAYSWCEATVEDVRGLWNHFGSSDGRFVFDFTSNNGILCLQSVIQFNILNQIPLDDNGFTWQGYEWLYKRFEYTFDEFYKIVYKPSNLGEWKFYEFEANKVDHHAGRTQV